MQLDGVYLEETQITASRESVAPISVYIYMYVPYTCTHCSRFSNRMIRSFVLTGYS